MQKQRIVLAGGTGFLGKILTRHFTNQGCEVIVLTRKPRASSSGDALVREIEWDGKTIGPWANFLNGATAVINLAGRSVNCRYHARNRREIMDSRVEPTRVIGQAIAQCSEPPKVWLNSSTATIYKHTFDREMDECATDFSPTPEAKDAFSVQVAQAWEKALAEATIPRTRKVALRISMVMAPMEGTVFRVLRRLVKFGLGGKMGNGKQYVSWIHETDFCRSIEWLIEHPELSGSVNIAAPNPIPNAEMMRELRQVVGRRIGLPASRWMLEFGAIFLRTETELILKSRRVVPGKLLASGFAFQYPSLLAAFENLEKLVKEH